MKRRYAIVATNGTLVIELSEEKKITIEIVEKGMQVEILDVLYDEDHILIKSQFFMFPDIIDEAKIVDCGDYLEVKGSFALFGQVDGRAEYFKGMTKYEAMQEAMATYIRPDSVKRSDEEIEKAVERLLLSMTLEEKIGQMSQGTGRNIAAIGSGGSEHISEMEAIEQGMMGSIISMTGPGIIYEQQKAAVEQSRLGIPLLFCQDVIHGYETIFPIPLAWSCSFNPDLVEKAMSIAAREATSEGINYGFSPMLDIARDPRWGRVSEGNGEDPYLCARMCEAHVRGFQGDDLSDDATMIACMKHFIGYSAAEGGRDYNTTEITDNTLYNIYCPPFQAGIDAGCASVMNSFNVLDGLPLVGNRRMSHELLRTKMGFDGILISDFAALDELMIHGVAQNGYDAAVLGAEASLDIEMGISNYHLYLKEAVKKGHISHERIDDSVRRILTYKYKTGLMDDPYKYLQPEKKDMIYSQDHLKVSYDLAKESIVLLKNDGILPLSKDVKIALIGPTADTTDLFGPWQFSKREKETKTIRQSLQDQGYVIGYETGCELSSEVEGGIDRALVLAKNMDLIVLCLGENKAMSGEAASKQDLHLPKAQLKLTRRLRELDKPMVLILTNGRPLILDGLEDEMNGILETWFLGSMAGPAIADTITGEVNPSGKLSMTFPRHPGQIPIYYNHLRTGRPNASGSPNKFLSKYLDGSNEPLYSFGYGQSYTQFELSDCFLSQTTLTADEEVILSATLKNVGSREGSEVVQVYCWDVVAKVARPIKELIGFRKINLKPKEKVTVTFKMTRELLSYYDRDYHRTIEAGDVMIYIGTSARDEDLQALKIEII